MNFNLFDPFHQMFEVMDPEQLTPGFFWVFFLTAFALGVIVTYCLAGGFLYWRGVRRGLSLHRTRRGSNL